MQRRYLARQALRHLRSGNLERWPRVHFYPAHDLALAGNRQRFQTLSRKDGWARERHTDRNQTD
jgi:hypothetical protein